MGSVADVNSIGSMKIVGKPSWAFCALISVVFYPSAASEEIDRVIYSEFV